jgi:arginine-tRNA-protein transferase
MSGYGETPLFRLQFYLTAAYPCSYLEEHQARSQVAAPGGLVDTAVYSELVRLGFRRSGRHVYRPRCDACRACVPVRLRVEEFRPNRSQRRCAARNADLAVALKPLAFDEAHYRLYRRYQQMRHPGAGMDQDDRDQYAGFLLQSDVDSGLLEFSLNGEPIMVALVDRLLDGISAVYTFFDPALERRSLGVQGVLAEIALTQAHHLPYLYLGYWIAQCRKMSYKSAYQPLEMLRDGRWQPFDEAPNGATA